MDEHEHEARRSTSIAFQLPASPISTQVFVSQTLLNLDCHHVGTDSLCSDSVGPFR